MSLWESFKKALNQIENKADRASRRVRRYLYRNTDVTIMPYVGYGNQTHVRLRGRVLENHSVRDAQETDSSARNFLNVIRRFISDELPHVPLSITFQGQQQTVITDEEGFFYAEFDLNEPLTDVHYDAEYYYKDSRRDSQAIGEVIIAPVNAQYAVVSDMDDTVIRSNVPNRIKLIANTLFNNSRTRLPFAGVAEFYRYLQIGTRQNFNPIYYVSNSPYNLYDLLHDFFNVRSIPTGPIFLRDFGLTQRYLGASDSHKTKKIKPLGALHPDLQFILIGDSGEHDPEIYAEIVRQHPDRVAAVYIRNVRPNSEWKINNQVHQFADEIREHGVDMLLVPDTLAAAQHAYEQGFVVEQCLHDVQKAVEADLPSNPIEAFIDDATS